jgi:hypothetical protein
MGGTGSKYARSENGEAASSSGAGQGLRYTVGVPLLLLLVWAPLVCGALGAGAASGIGTVSRAARTGFSGGRVSAGAGSSGGGMGRSSAELDLRPSSDLDMDERRGSDEDEPAEPGVTAQRGQGRG